MGDGDREPLDDMVNVMAGDAGQAVQARDIGGDVYVHGAGMPKLPRPRQLPRDITHFIGRRPELGKLNLLLESCISRQASTVVISAIAGAAGIGKTSLAVH